MLALVSSGCSRLAAREIVYSPTFYRQPEVTVDDDRAPLGPKASQSIIDASVEGHADSDTVHNLMSVEEAVTDARLMAGNRVKLLIDGPAAYAEIFKAIKAARSSIHLETYILADDEIGDSFAKELIAKTRAGVEVRVLYDAFGSLSTSSEFLDGLKNGGIHLQAFGPLSPLSEPIWDVNHRDHRKILVVDGRVGFTGGMNVSGVYTSSSFSPPEPEDKAPMDHGWRDTHVRIDGPAVAELQRLFLANWNEQSDQHVDEPRDRYFPDLKPAGDELVRIIASKGDDEDVEIYEAYVAVTVRARERIWITQAYFAPNEEMLDALKHAAERGVDVRILVPGTSDLEVVLNASRAEYQHLLDAGVRIYERDDAMVHAKTAVVDGFWSTVGSANYDTMSFLHNDEANAVVVSRDFGREMETLFMRDVRHAREIDADRWRRRPFTRKIVEQLANLFQYWI